jgi:hypothetical protein
VDYYGRSRENLSMFGVGVGLDKFEHNFEIHVKIMKTWYFGVCNEKWVIMYKLQSKLQCNI